MKICVVQTRPIKGDVASNIADHKKMIDLAVVDGADMVIFPELSLTGYEPTLAQELAMSPQDAQLDEFQVISDAENVTIGAGIPTENGQGYCISMVLFQPNQPRRIYSKKYLYVDEKSFFVSGENFPVLPVNERQIGLAICYELSVAAHAETAVASGVDVYVASVAKTKAGVEHASKRLAHIAQTHNMPALMSNCVGPADNFMSAGKTAVWNKDGQLLAQLDDTNEGYIIFDTDNEAVIARTLRHDPS